MPADSDGQPAALPVTWRPLGPRIVGVAVGVGLVVICAFAWAGFDERTQESFNIFQRITLLALGLGAFAGLHALLRSRVEAHLDRLVVVNGYRRREYEWPQVVAVRMPPGAPWVTLDLADGENAPAMGIQGSDGARAQVAVRELRRILAERSRID